ncbi:hypothetical protein TSMG0151 [Halocynthia phage JM-2012]|uniref:hypothetical protein n=1 Tax=Halocynthia phage JM-2012 TaxID=1173297 RepID=UPI00025C6973|nr:hypothetical protein TSMG0151 [Halocynthia phage JM-2012]AFI55434.1 hypothetical protein TSMG0151 [Halocynthia phage JM-2012]
MKFIPAIQSDDLSGIKIEHKNEVLNFNLRKSNGKRGWSDLANIFNPINSLFSALDAEEQDQMFTIYTNIYDLTLHKVGGDNFDLLVADLVTYITGIFELIPLKGIMAWATGSYDKFAVPETIGEHTVLGNYPASTSYNRHEYLELCGLSTALKLVLPITYEFMKEFKEVFGTQFKEYNMMFLFSDLHLEEVPPFAKLLEQAKDKLMVRNEIVVPMGLLIQGIGAEHYPLFSISTEVIRTLCLSETDVAFRRDGVPNNITAKLTKAIDKKIELNKSNFSYSDTEVPRERAGTDAGNTSNQEASNTIQRFSDLYGRFFLKEWSRPDFYKRYSISPETYEKFRAHVKLHPPTPTIEKKVLISLCFPKFANIESLTLIPNKTSMDTLTSAAALLHDMHLPQLVNFLLARKDEDTSTTSLNQYVASDSKPNKDLLTKLRPLYPTSDGGNNYGEEGIKELVASICKSHWIKMSPPNLHESYGMNQEWCGDRDLKNHLIMLIIARGV